MERAFVQASSSALGSAKWWIAPVAIVTLATLAYANSLRGAFVFDDHSSIIDAPDLRAPTPPGDWTPGTRPLLRLTLWANYQWGELDVAGYHVVNLVIHAATGLLLFAVTRRFFNGRSDRRSSTAGDGFAIAATLLWVAHPLNTQAVTYVVQRCEALMAMFALATLFGIGRAADAPTRAAAFGWAVVAVAAALLSAMSKQVAVVLPVLGLLWDRACFATSFTQAITRRWPIYVGLILISAWLVLGAVPRRVEPIPQQRPATDGEPEVQSPPNDATAGLELRAIRPLEYLRTQAEVILYYLRLAAWPHPLCLDHAWPVQHSTRVYIPSALAIGALMLASAALWYRSPRLGFPALAFWLCLAPTSSILPILDVAVEHRMYLPLAWLCVLAVRGSAALPAWGARNLGMNQSRFLRGLSAFYGLILIAFTGLTILRNEDYRSEERIWQQTLKVAPHNLRAKQNWGKELSAQGRLRDAEPLFRDVLDRVPQLADARIGLAGVLLATNRPAEAAAHYRQLLPSRDERVLSGLALSYLGLRQWDLADEFLRQGLAAGVRDPDLLRHAAREVAQVDPDRALRYLHAADQIDAQLQQR